VQVGFYKTIEINQLKCHTHILEHKWWSLSKAHNSYIDFDRIMALLELKKFYIIKAFILLSRTVLLTAHVLLFFPSIKAGSTM
jgi:hypothetical protein